MSFIATDLSVLGYANGFTHWHYRTPDALYDLLGPRYFAGARELLRAGDQITVNLVGESRVDLASVAVISLDPAAGPVLAMLARSLPPEPIPFRQAA